MLSFAGETTGQMGSCDDADVNAHVDVQFVETLKKERMS